MISVSGDKSGEQAGVIAASDPSLDTCSLEPIRVPGGIQPHGALLVLDRAGTTILQVSSNASGLLNHGPGALLNRNLSVLESPTLQTDLRDWLVSVSSSGPDTPFLRTTQVAGRTLQALAHRTAQGVLIEFEEPPRSEGETLEALYPRIGRFMEEVESYDDLTQMAQAAAQEFRRITGFNRVLMYRFDRDWHGAVIAEDGDGVLPSYLGLHFPASDIPAQARELYRLNRLRLIPDANYVPATLQPLLNPVDGAPLDLSFASLRSVSPVHLEYMRNMGTAASMSVSILVEGKLWGLVSCHNAAPRRLNAQARTACDLLGKVVSQQVASRQRGAYAADRIRLKRIETDLVANLAMSSSFQEGLALNAAAWLGFVAAGGAAVLYESTVIAVGNTPSEARIRDLSQRLREDQGGDVFSTDSLAVQFPEFADIADVASGVLAISISQLHPAYIIWFRPEQVSTVTWGGNPGKTTDPTTHRLNPRTSFASWQQQVRLQAAPWSAAEIDSVVDFRGAIVNFVLRRAEERAQLTSELQRSNRELESFSYSVSHDLRAPFRHIVGYTQLLRDLETSLSDKSLHYLDSINEAATTAGQLVDDLLSFSHLGRTTLAKTTVDMQKLVQEALRSLQPDLQHRTIDWQIGRLPPAWGDPMLLRQALLNLIGNAVKYTRNRPAARIEIHGEVTPNECIYSITDNGAGFDMAYVHKLFGVFQRLHRMEEFEGTGIGLALTKRIIERHHGWIKAQGALDNGASFQFSLPVRTGDASNG